MKKLILYSCLLLISISASAQVPSYVPTNGLVGYWPFNGNANDASSNGYNLINYNVTYGNDKSQAANACAYFSGNGSYFKSQTAFSQFTTSPKQSYSFWFKNVASNWRYIVNYANSTSCRIGIVPNTLASTKSVGLIATTGCCPIQSSCGIGTFNTTGLDAGWHHIVVSIDISNYSVFYDGTLVSTQTHSGFNCADTSFRFQLGKECFGANYYNMYLDDIAVWNRNLTQSEVTALYNQSPNPVLPSNVPTSGLVAYYPFNGNANDVSGNGNNGVAIGTSYISDKNGNTSSAISFSPTSYVNITSNFILNNSNGLTFASWVNFNSIITSSGNGNTIVDFSDGNCVNCWSYRYYIVQDANKIHFGREGSLGGVGFKITANKTLAPSTWYYVVGTIDTLTGQARLFINGTLEGNTNANTKPISFSSGATNSKIFGMATLAPNNGNQLNGKLDDIGIWNRALTQSEITALYNQTPTSVLPSNVPTAGLVAYYPFNGNANDASGNGNNGTVNGATLTTDKIGSLNSAYSFDGNDWVESTISSIPTGSSPRTISIWTNATNTTNTSGRTAFHYGINTTNNRFCILQWPLQPVVVAQANDACSNCSGTTTINPSSVQSNQWNNFIVTYDGTTMKFYINGVISFQSARTYNTTYSSFKIGKSIDTHLSGEYFTGKLDDIGIWNRALTQSEITALYNNPTAVASDSLWVINKQIDTLAFPLQVKLSLKSNNITSKNISAYDIKLNYDASKLKFDSVTKTNTASANGNLIVNSATAGQVIVGWASSSNISSATLPLLDLYFTPIDSGKTTVSISNAIFNTDTVKNRYSKSVINKFNFGDVDMNKIIQSYDASVVLKYSIGIDPLPTIDPLPWEPWRIKVASVDSTLAVDANDASLILKYSVGIITKFPKRGILSAPGYVTVNLENNELVVRSFEDMGGLNITFLDHLSDLGAPTYVHNTNALSAFNKQTNTYKIGVAFSEAPINGTVILRIPYTGLGSQTLNMELVENTSVRNYQLNVVTGINDIKNSNIKIYPNPTNSIINIEGLNKNENSSIQIFDVQGKLVTTKTITEKGAIDLSELNKGVYVIKIGEVAQRIVKM